MFCRESLYVSSPRGAPGSVIVSTTTLPRDGGLFRRVLEAVAPMDVPVLATSAGADEIPKGLGDHIRIERYIAHDEVFPEARALITHGGWGTVGKTFSTKLNKPGMEQVKTFNLRVLLLVNIRQDGAVYLDDFQLVEKK